MEGDAASPGAGQTPAHFYPRPHMEGDRATWICSMTPSRFLPTPSHGGRLPDHNSVKGVNEFLPTPSHGGRQGDRPIGQPPLYFYPRPHMEGDLLPARCRRFHPNFYPRPHMEGDSKHAEVQACISAAYLKCSTRKAAASRRCADLGGRAVLFHQLSRLVLGRARCEPRGEGMCDRGSHRQSGRRKGLKTHSSKMSSWLH